MVLSPERHKPLHTTSTWATLRTPPPCCHKVWQMLLCAFLLTVCVHRVNLSTCREKIAQELGISLPNAFVLNGNSSSLEKKKDKTGQ